VKSDSNDSDVKLSLYSVKFIKLQLYAKCFFKKKRKKKKEKKNELSSLTFETRVRRGLGEFFFLIFFFITYINTSFVLI
jgi:hypothetical protein